MASIIPTDGVLINTAPIADSITPDMYVIGYRGNGESASLVAISTTLLTSSRAASPSLRAASVAPQQDVLHATLASEDAPVEVSLEELFDEAHNLYKDCWLQLRVFPEGLVGIEGKANLPDFEFETSEQKIGRINYIKVSTDLKTLDFNMATAQVSQISLGPSFASAAICVEEDLISFLVKNTPSLVNFMVKAPLTTADHIEFANE